MLMSVPIGQPEPRGHTEVDRRRATAGAGRTAQHFPRAVGHQSRSSAQILRHRPAIAGMRLSPRRELARRIRLC
jgi:hypothetical protein